MAKYSQGEATMFILEQKIKAKTYIKQR